MNKFFAEVKDGWPKPATRRDRIISVVFGGLGATPIGMTVRIVAARCRSLRGDWARWAVSCAAIGAALGLAVPISTILAFYPFVKLFGAILEACGLASKGSLVPMEARPRTAATGRRRYDCSDRFEAARGQKPTVAIDCFRSSRCIAHMGRQFSYFACPEDLAEIQREVFAPMNGRLVIAEKRDGAHHLTSAESFSLGVERMGKETLFLLLVPPPPLEKMVFSGPWLDDARSSVMQVGRSYIKDGRIKSARFWYEPSAFENGQACMKPPEFIDWASAVFRRTKKLLVRRTTSCGFHEYTDWYGKVAARAVDQKMLEPVIV